MRFVILLAVLATPASTFSHPSQSPTGREISAPVRGAKLDCVAYRVQHALQGPKKPDFNRLGELPPGDLHLAVMREVDGCQEPVIVRQDIGGLRAEPVRPGRR
ncbi:MAG TPA: hypothetical protein VF631_04825 [Allosphingosinicella sp.]|jgi:hypothetical protein|uniref:hypothetical protein n=1 Tax=Allosphingosinicella sp. TaxID=2823234 RepID=UPI002F29BF85